MVMTDNNQFLDELFKQAAQQQIEDNGFTERVMQQLPDAKRDSVRRLSRLWSLFCILVGVGLFFAFGGWQVLQGLFIGGLRMLLGWLEVFALTIPTTEININLWTVLLLMAFVLVVLPYQTYRKLSATL
jgi:hypothetical protein